MKIFNKVVLSTLVLFLLACGSSQKIKESNTALDEMMSQKAFKIKVRTAEPLVTQAMGQIATSGMIPPGNSVGRIDVAGSGYFIEVNGDSVSANLPYFGERQMGGGYDSDPGIKFEGIAKNLSITKDETKQSYKVTFDIASSIENYLVTIGAGTNLTSSTSIRSSHRNRIRYSGTVSDLKE